MGEHHRHVGVPLVGTLPRERFVEDTTERVDVRGGRDLLRVDLLGRRVVGRPDEDARLGQVTVTALLRDPEVHQVDAAGAVLDHHVRRLHVAVDHLVGVCRVERSRDLLQDRERVVRILRASVGDQLPEVGPVHVAHRDVRHPVEVAGVVDRDDVRMVDRGDRLRLADEPLLEVVAAAELGREGLQGGLALEQHMFGLVDEAHAAASEQAGDPVPGELHASAKSAIHVRDSTSVRKLPRSCIGAGIRPRLQS